MDKAQRFGLSVGEFVRTRAMGSRPRRPGQVEFPPAVPADMDLAIQLRKIGVNLNQIAHH